MQKRTRATGSPPQRRARSWAWRVPIVATVLIALLFYLGGGWYFSSVLDTLALSAAAKRASRPSYPLRVEAISPAAITLGMGSAAPGDLTRAGVWGLQWPGGAGVLAQIRARAARGVTRTFHLVTGTAPVVGEHVGMDSSVYPQNPGVGLGLPYRNVTYPGPLGTYPAWLVAGRSTTWAITVHGNSLSRLDCMKIVPVLHGMGLPVLMITYRNDPGAPPSSHGEMRYGQTEWIDLQAATRYALAHGAHRVVLVGYSMGGGIVLSFLIHSPLARKVQAVVLDAPVTDFSTTVNFGAAQQRIPVIGLPLPQSLTDVAKWIASYRYHVNWSATDYLDHTAALHAPILLFQGTADHTVPPATSAALAQARPHLVQYVVTGGAGHLESWNLHPRRYDNAVRALITRTGGPGAPASPIATAGGPNRAGA